MNKYDKQDEIAYWVCDFGWVAALIAFLLLAAFFIRRWSHPTNSPSPAPLSPTSTSTVSMRSSPTATIPQPAIPSASFTPTHILPQATPRPTESPKPEFVFVVMPVKWSGERRDFEKAARNQLNLFINESGMDDIFRTRLVLLEDGPVDVSLSDRTLTYDVIEYGLDHSPGDRYIGLTDGDLADSDNSLVSGWSNGPNSIGVVGEAAANSISIAAHELAHTFGLCDEYSFLYWQEQNGAFADGCPNPFPPNCDHSTNATVMCEGDPTDDGRNSIMGPSGLDGAYGFNSASREHLQKAFENLLQQVTP